MVVENLSTRIEPPTSNVRLRRRWLPWNGLGVWIIGILGLIGAVLRILAALTLLGITGLALTGTLGDQADLGASSILFGVLQLLLGVVWMVVLFAFIGLQPWSWMVMVVWEFFLIIVPVVQFFFDGFQRATLLGVILPLIILLCLYTSRVRRAFSVDTELGV